MVTEVNHPLNHSHLEGTIYLHKLWGIMPGEGEGEGGGGGERERETSNNNNRNNTKQLLHCIHNTLLTFCKVTRNGSEEVGSFLLPFTDHHHVSFVTAYIHQ